MKANELRIGNYFRRMYGHGYEDIVEASIDDILEINTKPWNDHVFFDGIELTNEWLKKLGFVCTWAGQGDGQTWEKGKVELHGDFYPLHLSNHKIDWIHLPKIEYVHQLQNLYFALTGEELTIK